MEEKTKSLNENSLIMDINLIEAPFFLFKHQSKVRVAQDLKQDESISSDVRKILDAIPMQQENMCVEYISWVDSKNFKREVFAMSTLALPNAFAMDVWYGLIGLYIQKNSPILYDDETKMYDFKSTKVEFTLYELATFMNLNTSGVNTERIKLAILQLKAAQYYSLGNGSIYNKQKEKYLKSNLKDITLISNFEFETQKDAKNQKRSKDKCMVVFNDLIVENIKREFIKYLNKDTFFKLPSGLSRRLYTYVEGNKYRKEGKLNHYIKRSYNVIGRKLPIEFKYNSEFKRRINKPLESLKNIGLIEDFFFGDDILINGIKEACVYIIFVGNKEDIIESLTVKNNVILIEEKLDDKPILEIPKDIRQELIDLGIAPEKASEMIQKYNKWNLIEYVLWAKEKSKEDGIKNLAGLLIFALQTKNVKLENTHQYILDFVKEEREKTEIKVLSDDEIRIEYDKYIESEINNFKSEDEALFEFIKSSIFDSMCENLDDKIIQRTNNINKCKDDDFEARKVFTEQLEELLDLKNNGIKSKAFKKRFQPEISIMREFKDFNSFKIELLKKGKKGTK